MALRSWREFDSLTGLPAASGPQRLDLATAVPPRHETWIYCAFVSSHKMFHESFVANHPHNCNPVFSDVSHCVSETRVGILSLCRFFGLVGVGSESPPVRHTIRMNQVNVEAKEECVTRPKGKLEGGILT